MKHLIPNLFVTCFLILPTSYFSTLKAQNISQKIIIGYVTNQQIPVFLEKKSDTIINNETHWRANISIGSPQRPAQNLHDFTLNLYHSNQSHGSGISTVYCGNSWFGTNTQVQTQTQTPNTTHTVINFTRLTASGASGTGIIARISGGGGIGENVQGRPSGAGSNTDILNYFDIQTTGNEGIVPNTILYPNPSVAGEAVNIFIPNEAANMYIQDMTGRILMQQNIASSSTISTENWVAGVYFIHLDFADRKETKRLVIK
jgi:Secretion system C-terminal sorting domain